MHDINFVYELGDTDRGKASQYEISEMYGIPQ
jgi:hypothetical protein